MHTTYNPDTLRDYKAYRREVRKKGFNHMDFEEFEFLWNNEFSSGQIAHQKIESAQWRFV